MAQDYWDRIKQKVRTFWSPGDQLICIAIVDKPDGTCELCGHLPITRRFSLRNSRSGVTIVVGSECIHNHKQVVEKLGEELKIFFPEDNREAREAAEWLNRKYPGTVILQSSVYLDELLSEWGRQNWDFSELSDSKMDWEERAPEGMDSEEIDWEASHE